MARQFPAEAGKTKEQPEPMRRLTILLIALLGLASCAAGPNRTPEETAKPGEMVSTPHYRSPNPPTLSLLTEINLESGNGGHTALLVDASERVVFDPAGSFRHPQMNRQDDVFYGMNDRAVNVFIDYYSRGVWKVVRQDIRVSEETAEQALELVTTHGRVRKAFCTSSTSKLLSRLPGFERIHGTMFPVSLMNQVAGLEGVTSSTYHDMRFNSRGQLVAANN